MIIKVFPDKERIKSMLNLIKNREKFLSEIENKESEFPTIVMENYYEIIKELAIALLLCDGKKIVSENFHKELIDHLKYYSFTEEEIILLHDLRKKRNLSYYEGKSIEISYIALKKEKFKKIIKKLKKLIKKKLKI